MDSAAFARVVLSGRASLFDRTIHSSVGSWLVKDGLGAAPADLLLFFPLPLSAVPIDLEKRENRLVELADRRGPSSSLRALEEKSFWPLLLPKEKNFFFDGV